MTFKTAYGKHESKPSEAGRPMKNEYDYKINKKGQKVLTKVGETNLQEAIQAHYEECLIENIMQQAAQGDMSHFRPDGIYADIGDMPNNLVESMERINQLETIWTEVPMEIKEKYNYSLEEFVGASGTDKWLEDMGLKGVDVVEENKVKQELPTAAALGQTDEHKKEGEV